MWAGTNSCEGPRRQPGDVADVLLHETAISWLKASLAKSDANVQSRWKETPEELAKRITTVVRELNAECEVANLCRKWPARLQALKAAEGGRLPP